MSAVYEQSADRTSEVPKHTPRKENAVRVKFGERPLPVARLDLHFPITLPKAVDSLRTNVTDRGDVLFPKLDGAERPLVVSPGSTTIMLYVCTISATNVLFPFAASSQ